MTEPNPGTTSFGSYSPEAAGLGTTTERASDAADQAKSKLEGARAPIADKLQSAADALREHAGRLPGGERVAGAARSAADQLESSASYLQSHNTREMAQDLMGVVKRHPTPSLLIAGTVGFLLGRALRRSD